MKLIERLRFLLDRLVALFLKIGEKESNRKKDFLKAQTTTQEGLRRVGGKLPPRS